MKLKYQLFTTITLLFTIFTLTVWFFSAQKNEKINELLAKKLVQANVELEKTKILSPIISEIDLVKQMAHDPALIEIAKDKNNSQLRKNELAKLEKYRMQFHDKSYFISFLNSSNAYFIENNSSQNGTQVFHYILSPTNPENNWFYATITANEPFQINIQTEIASGRTKVWINYLLKDKGKIIGVIGTGFDLQELLKNYSNYKKINENMGFYIKKDLSIQLAKNIHDISYDNLGKSKTNQQKNISMLIKDPEDLKRIKEAMYSVQHSKDIHAVKTLWVNIQGERNLLGIQYSPEVRWFSLMLFDEDDLIAIDNLDIFLMIAALGVIAIILLLFKLNAAIVQPVEQLIKNMNSAEKGDLDIDFNTKGSIELQSLAKRFKDLLGMVKERSELLETIFNSTKEGIGIIDKDSKFIYTNAHYYELLGYTELEFYQKTCLELTHPEDLKIAIDAMSTVNAQGYTKNFKKRFLKKDGSIIEAKVSITTLPDRDDFLFIFNDVTEENRLKIEHLEHENLMLQQSRLAQMGEMISMIAHQWRQPLSAIASAVITVKLRLELESFDLTTQDGRDELNNFLIEKFHNIENYIENLTTTIDDFRNLHKPNKKAVLCSFKQVVDKALRIIKSSMEVDNITIIEEYNDEISLEMYDNEMMQVILNILKNAQDNFKEKNISNPEIKISSHNRSLFISDNGGGIPDEILFKIFDPYFSTKSEKNGTGLGLYMSKTIIENHHNGSIKVKNQNNGASFRIKLEEAKHG